VLASSWPLWLLFTLDADCLILVTGFLAWRRASMKWWQLGILGLLQAAMLALALFVVWQPALVNERLLPGENAVAVMLDTSASMALTDGETSRMVQAQALLTPEALEELGETYTVLPYGFAGGANALTSFSELPDPGTSTVLGQSILQTLRQASSSSLGAVILVSDGADNSGAIAQSELNEIIGFGVPIHTVGIGRTVMPEDLELDEVALPNKALAGTTLSARVNIRHDAGGTARVKVYNGD